MTQKYFDQRFGDVETRTCRAIQSRFTVVISSLMLFTICAVIFYISQINFMIK